MTTLIPKFQQIGIGAVNRAINLKLAESVSVKDFGATGDGTTDDYDAILAAWTYCLASSKNLYFPAGEYSVGGENFPFRNPTVGATTLLDCNDITIYGEGYATVLKTISVGGADVLQLNAVKNLTIRNLAVTATISGSASGSNGVSVTGGFDNINLLDIYCLDLPRVDKGLGVIDGGGALSIQTPATGQVTPCGSIIARLTAKGCYYGVLVSGKLDILQTIGNNQSITVDILAKDCCIGVFDGYTVDATYPAFGSTTGVVVRATTVDCQVDYFAPIQAVGSDITTKVVTSKTKAARLLDPSGVRWDNTTVAITDNGLYSPGQLCLATLIKRAHNCTIKVTGDKGACDYKAAIGASATGANAGTIYSSIYIDIGGTASTTPVIEIVNAGSCLSYANIEATLSTATASELKTNAPFFFLVGRFNRITSGSQVYGEEGTITPILVDAARIDKGATYSTQQGNYVVQGGWVHFQLFMVVTGLGTLTVGDLALIKGLPYTNTTVGIASCAVGFSTGMSLAANNIPCARLGSADTCIQLAAFRAGASATNMLISEFSATGTIAVSGSYKADI
jgi:hypothetical protein